VQCTFWLCVGIGIWVSRQILATDVVADTGHKPVNKGGGRGCQLWSPGLSGGPVASVHLLLLLRCLAPHHVALKKPAAINSGLLAVIIIYEGISPHRAQQ
jgi:hypothetical protein